MGRAMVVCELCESMPARLYCESDRASLCWDCDASVHGANFLVPKHRRSMLCHTCQSQTPWKASGSKLPPSLSLCLSCSSPAIKCSLPHPPSKHLEQVVEHMHDDQQVSPSIRDCDQVVGSQGSDDEEDGNNEEEQEECMSYSDDQEQDDDGGDNQVVPSTPTARSSNKLQHDDDDDDNFDDDDDEKIGVFFPPLSTHLKRKADMAFSTSSHHLVRF